MANIVENFLVLNNTKKITYLVLLAGAIAGVVFLYRWAAEPQYQILYSNLSPDDASAIVERLRDKHIPYRVEVGGTAVAVAQERVYETRLELAGSGIPRGGGIGFEIFDKSGLGMTEFSQKINYLRAIQGELARTIGWLSEVETARVHIVVPERRLFSEKEENAAASVVLKLRPGRRLNNNQVQGIVHLVASSVTGLSPQNVTVIDTTGQVFTRASESSDSFLSLSSSQLDYQKSFEKDMETRIQGIIEPVVGAGKVIARVSADLDFKKVERTEEKYDPESVVVRSEQRTKEKSLGETAAGGIPGVASNTPGAQVQPQQQTQASPSQSQRQNEIINYEISKVISRTVEPSGVVKRLSVAVLVDGAYEVKKTADGTEEKKYVPRTQEEIKKLEDLVKGAVGFVAERGDKIEVSNVPFEAQAKVPEGGEEAPKLGIKEYLPVIIRYGAITVLSLLLFLFVLRPLIAGLSQGGAGGGAVETALPEALKTLEQGLGQKALGSSSGDVRQRILELAKQNPQQAAQIVKAWVKEK